MSNNVWLQYHNFKYGKDRIKYLEYALGCEFEESLPYGEDCYFAQGSPVNFDESFIPYLRKLKRKHKNSKSITKSINSLIRYIKKYEIITVAHNCWY